MLLFFSHNLHFRSCCIILDTVSSCASVYTQTHTARSVGSWQFSIGSSEQTTTVGSDPCIHVSALNLVWSRALVSMASYFCCLVFHKKQLSHGCAVCIYVCVCVCVCVRSCFCWGLWKSKWWKAYVLSHSRWWSNKQHGAVFCTVVSLMLFTFWGWFGFHPDTIWKSLEKV
jgi:hypothetical protein